MIIRDDVTRAYLNERHILRMPTKEHVLNMLNYTEAAEANDATTFL